MIKNYLKIAWRNLVKNKFSSLINIGGLAVGMAVAMLIGLWIYGELSFDKSFPNHDSIATVMQNQWINNETDTWNSQAYPLGPELRSKYGADFKHVIMTSWTGGHILSYGDKNLKISGNFMEPGITDMLSLKMIKGSHNGLKDPKSMLLSTSSAKAIFGNADPMDKTIIIDHDNMLTVKVTGIYEDLPENSSFGDLTFISPWQLLVKDQHYDTRFNNPWGASWFQTLVQVADNADMDKVSAKIKYIKKDDLARTHNSDARFRPVIFLHPMNKWHLYSDFKNGVNTGGDIRYVWLFGIIGVFVLLLACINFMNLSTARSEKRAKEVGIRKSVGSVRSQLVTQFYCESMLIAAFSFVCALLLVQLCLPFFNEVAGKKVSILWGSPLFWLAGIGFTLFTGLIAGSYPALYLSSFNPVKVLKGTFRAGRLASVPRKVLVVLQFTVSIALIIGTIVVFNQIQYAKNRPIGYSVNGLMIVPLQTDAIIKQYDAIKNDLMSSGVVASVSRSDTRITTNGDYSNGGFTWQGKDPALQENFKSVGVSPEFGKTVKWEINEGRDFNPAFPSDSSAFIINEAAVKYLGFKNPIGQTITWTGSGNYKIIGVVKDMVIESAYQPVEQTFFYLPKTLNNVDIRLDANTGAHDAISKIGAIFKKYDPSTPFEYSFADDDYAKKFDNEERIGKLSSTFAALAIFISCLGLFGMASFMAEQRTKEIGIRKVLGATVFNLWQLLSKDFVALVIISLLIAMPISYYFMHKWLQGYEYRTAITWTVFAVAAVGALIIAVLTVSYQSIKAAVANPVKSLKTE